MKSYKLITLFSLVTVTLLSAMSSCGEKETPQDRLTGNNLEQNNLAKVGKALMEKQCYLCHNPATVKAERIAPPLVEVKSHYLTDISTKEEFTKAVMEFIKNPTSEKAKMKGAVDQFKLMPKQEFSEKELSLICAYIHDYQIEEPSWFKDHMDKTPEKGFKYNNQGKAEKSNSKTSKTSSEIGLDYAMSTKKVLGKNLMGTIQKKGTLEALNFCNAQAYPLTDSMAVAQNARIKRVSDKPRNPKNQASKRELDLIEKFKLDVANGTEIIGYTEESHSKVQFYYPITTNSMCLQCHGMTGGDITEVVSASISELYPNDKATGYEANQIRGIWNVEFEK